MSDSEDERLQQACFDVHLPPTHLNALIMNDWRTRPMLSAAKTRVTRVLQGRLLKQLCVTSKLVTQTHAAGGELQITCAATKVCKLCHLLQNAGPHLRGRSARGLSGFCDKKNLSWFRRWPCFQQEAGPETSCGLFQPELFYDFVKCLFLINSCLALPAWLLTIVNLNSPCSLCYLKTISLSFDHIPIPQTSLEFQVQILPEDQVWNATTCGEHSRGTESTKCRTEFFEWKTQILAPPTVMGGSDLVNGHTKTSVGPGVMGNKLVNTSMRC